MAYDPFSVLYIGFSFFGRLSFLVVGEHFQLFSRVHSHLQPKIDHLALFICSFFVIVIPMSANLSSATFLLAKAMDGQRCTAAVEIAFRKIHFGRRALGKHSITSFVSEQPVPWQRNHLVYFV